MVKISGKIPTVRSTIVQNHDVRLLYIDLFCGAGGTSTGVEQAQVRVRKLGKEIACKLAKVIACVNHDAKAIASHAANHPDALHFTEDIRTLDLTDLIRHVTNMRQVYPNARLVLWASLECTNHSKAKGGMSRDADSRTLAEHLERYIVALNPDSVQIENVEEFLIWGPLMVKIVEKDGVSSCPLRIVKTDEGANFYPIWVPDPKHKGECFRRWRDSVKALGYSFDYRLLNAADYSALTSRKRFFGQFSRPSFPTVWPKATHAKNPLPGSGLQKHRAVKEVLDFSDEGKSIFGRSKELVEATKARGLEGLIKYVAEGKENYEKRLQSVKNEQFSFLMLSADSPHSDFLAAYYGNGFTTSVNDSCMTVSTKDRFSLWRISFIDQQFGQSKPVSLKDPLNSMTTKDKYAPWTAWIMNTNYSNIGSSINDPLNTITANRKWHYLMDAQYSRTGWSIDSPCFTLIARMDKTPPYLFEATRSGDFPDFIKLIDNCLIYEIYDTDSPMTKKIKEFMALYGIIDIKMRMLKIVELLQIMGFPADYLLIGSQADQKKFIGNAVEVNISRALCEATANKLYEDDLKMAA